MRRLQLRSARAHDEPRKLLAPIVIGNIAGLDLEEGRRERAQLGEIREEVARIEPAPRLEIRDGRLFIFGDVLGREQWLLDEKDNIAHADALWPSIADKAWRTQSLKAWLFKVPWYRDGKGLMARWRAKHPGEELHYDTGSMLDNVLFKPPGWRAREGYSQQRLGVPGEADDPFPSARS